jgi:isopenicillin N synthase-like dioxygenase
MASFLMTHLAKGNAVAKRLCISSAKQQAALLSSGTSAKVGTEGVPVVQLIDFYKGGQERVDFINTVGDALKDVGVFSIQSHGFDTPFRNLAYQHTEGFFNTPESVKKSFEDPAACGQRGFTSFGTEHAKDSTESDLKEFWQVVRPNVPDDHHIHAMYGPNVWPEEQVPGFKDTFVEAYSRLERISHVLLRACAIYIGEPEYSLAHGTIDSDTIMRLIHYPPVHPDAPTNAIRAGAHEDINLITMLVGSTEMGLELMGADGEWIPVKANYDEIVCQGGDMLQNLTNGLFRSTTHRVVNPPSASAHKPRFSMPFFCHPKRDFDLTPLPGCIARTGGEAKFQPITASAYLSQRLAEIGFTGK